MTASVNKCIILGKLGQTPELRYTQQGMAVASFSVATSRHQNKINGKTTDWHHIITLHQLAEIAAKHLNKGSQVYIEGYLRTRKYSGKDKIERTTTEIIADKLQILTGRNIRTSS